jgi:rhodanese-related sulfurtransferase
MNWITGKSSAQIQEALENGAQIIDVRTTAEYADGHVEGSINIPLDAIPQKAEELKALDKPLVLCCASGMRSGNATSFLKQQGIECYNGGSWVSLR